MIVSMCWTHNRSLEMCVPKKLKQLTLTTTILIMKASALSISFLAPVNQITDLPLVIHFAVIYYLSEDSGIVCELKNSV